MPGWNADLMHPSPYNSRLQEAQPPAPTQNEVPVPAVHGWYSAEKEGPVVQKATDPYSR